MRHIDHMRHEGYFGPGPEGAECGTCVNLMVHGWDRKRRIFKCFIFMELSGHKWVSSATDWRKCWPACGKYQARGERVDLPDDKEKNDHVSKNVDG